MPPLDLLKVLVEAHDDGDVVVHDLHDQVAHSLHEVHVGGEGGDRGRDVGGWTRVAVPEAQARGEKRHKGHVEEVGQDAATRVDGLHDEQVVLLLFEGGEQLSITHQLLTVSGRRLDEEVEALGQRRVEGIVYAVVLTHRGVVGRGLELHQRHGREGLSLHGRPERAVLGVDEHVHIVLLLVQDGAQTLYHQKVGVHAVSVGVE